MEKKKKVKRGDMLRKLIPQIILVCLIVFFYLAAGNRFLTVNNLISIVRQVSTMGIAAMGLSFLMITANLDFSIGAIYAFAGTFASACFINWGVPIYLAMALSAAGCVALSCFTCFISQTFTLPRLVTSIAMTSAISGLNVIISGNKTLYGLPEHIKWIGQGYIGPVPISAIIFFVIAVIVSFVLRKTYFGRYLFAVGGNEEVARLSGINTVKIKYMASIIAGLLTGIAGLVAMSRTFCGSPTAGGSLSSDVISACVLGGVSVMGGTGNTLGLVTGIIVIGTLSVGLNMMNMNSNAQEIFKGGMLLLAIVVDSVAKKRAQKATA